MNPALSLLDDRNEWLETDRLGGFASGTTTGLRTRRYHALLVAAMTPPTGRVALVNGFDAWVETDRGTVALTTQHYLPDVRQPDATGRITSFSPDPWPTWTFRLPDGTELEHEIFVVPENQRVAVTWRLHGKRPRLGLRLCVRPFVSGRDLHALHHENPSFRFEASGRDGCVVWHPYPGLPAIVVRFNGHYVHEPIWYRHFLYREDRDRGMDHAEDLASPGRFVWELSREDAAWVLAAQETPGGTPETDAAMPWLARARAVERRRRRRFPTRLHRAADAYVVRRGEGRTIIAGYPWFTDWGRDTFIALRGLCLSTGRLDEARSILLSWAGLVSQGMLPNRFTEAGDVPEFNSVDAALWYVVAVDEFLRATTAARRRIAAPERRVLDETVEAILSGYATGTRHRIHLDTDGLLAAGEPGLSLTWMDAKFRDWVVTPRIGKPVEVQALWLNALKIGSGVSSRWQTLFERGQTSLRERFWNDEAGQLHDVVDVDHRAGAVDSAVRPNQIFAVGGLPLVLLDARRAERVVAAVESRLWTPLGLRSLAPGEPAYQPRYEGDLKARDGAYHQGTVWPWLLGPFVEAWLRVRGGTAEARRQARQRFLDPILRHLEAAGIGHVSEIADAEPPHLPRGCPFQAWSVGEALRLAVDLLGERPRSP